MMKKMFFISLLFLLGSIKSFSQQFCFAHAANSYNKTLAISKVFDSADFPGTKDTYSGIKWSIKEAAKKAIQNTFGSRAYDYTSSLEYKARNDKGAEYDNAYDIGEERKKMVAEYRRKGYSVVEFRVERL